jgi:hypothetical protein
VHRDDAAARIADLNGIAEQPGEPQASATGYLRGRRQLAGKTSWMPSPPSVTSTMISALPCQPGQWWAAGRGITALVAIPLAASTISSVRAS